RQGRRPGRPEPLPLPPRRRPRRRSRPWKSSTTEFLASAPGLGQSRPGRRAEAPAVPAPELRGGLLFLSDIAADRSFVATRGAAAHPCLGLVVMRVAGCGGAVGRRVVSVGQDLQRAVKAMRADANVAGIRVVFRGAGVVEFRAGIGVLHESDVAITVAGPEV